ncbi:uncharacterized protein [Euphorbia lathyris]|uniref:uncharacterized protein isoform X1 n=1 Tax=Euphorbia lathyris TaxID=212925 RepID=UPI0033140A5D
MASFPKVVVFTDTNIDTHIAMPVSPDITATDFKRELERRHLSFFPALGEIEAHEVMVRRKNCFYHLTESLPIKYAFQGLKGRWFLHVGVHLVEKDGSCITDSEHNDKKKSNLEDGIKEFPNLNGHTRATGETIPEKREMESVVSTKCNIGLASENELKGKRKVRPLRVGRRILKATRTQNKQKPYISLYRLRVASVARVSVFEISDNDD